MKNIDILTIVTAFQKADGTLTLPVKAAWIRRVNMKKLMDAKAIIDEALQEIQQRYADDEHSIVDGDRRMVKPEYQAEFFRAQSDVLSQDTDVDIKTVSIDEIGDIEVTDKQMDTLKFMISE